MSKKFLKKMLIEVQRELEQSSGKGKTNFRLTTADLKEHRFRSSVNGVKNEVMRELISPTYNIDPRILNDERFRQVLDKYTKNLVNGTYLKAKKKYGSSAYTRVTGNKSAWSINVSEREKRFSSPKAFNPETVFKAVQNMYSSRLDTLINNLNKVLKTIDPNAFEGSKVQQIEKFRFLDLGHRSGSAIVEQQVGRASAEIKNRIEEYNRKSKDKITEKDIRNLGINSFVKKRATEEREVLEVGLEAEFYNREHGRDNEGPFKKEALKKLRKAVLQVDRATSLVDRPGSDSRLEIEKKKVIRSFDTKTTRRKNVKVKSKDFKPKITKNAKVVKKANKKVKKVKPKDLSLGQIKGIKAPGPKNSSANSNVSLGALINAKLSATVRENMGAPSLVNRTGRFANSVRVLEVTQTPQGYPSIGYTYQKRPYQVFENGAGVPPWADGNRDPRELIDRSIREIAAELLTGRFYTRRI